MAAMQEQFRINYETLADLVVRGDGSVSFTARYAGPVEE